MPNNEKGPEDLLTWNYKAQKQDVSPVRTYGLGTEPAPFLVIQWCAMWRAPVIWMQKIICRRPQGSRGRSLSKFQALNKQPSHRHASILRSQHKAAHCKKTQRHTQLDTRGRATKTPRTDKQAEGLEVQLNSRALASCARGPMFDPQLREGGRRRENKWIMIGKFPTQMAKSLWGRKPRSSWPHSRG